MTNRISAAGNILMDIEPGRWRLIDNAGLEEQTLFEATNRQSFEYNEEFSRTRRLPRDGTLQVTSVRQVVLGWSSDDESWHLGLLLGQELADTRGSRWCALAYWPDPETTQFTELAQSAGKSLAGILGLPFNYIPAEPQPEEPPPPLPELPLTIGDWTLQTVNSNTMELRRVPGWSRAQILQVAWYVLLTVVYFVLSYATLTSPIAKPRPEILGYMGFAMVILMIGIIIYTIYSTASQVTTIQIDSFMNSVKGLSGKRTLWSYSGREITAIYATQVADSGSRKRSKAAISHGELNLQLFDGKFICMIDHQQIDDSSPYWAEIMDGVTELTPEAARSNLQNAALHIARALEIPGYYDHRGRTR